MNTNSFVKSKYRVSLVVLLLLALVFSLGPDRPSLAQGGELRRAEIIEIARRYATHSWTATSNNVLHTDIVDTPNREYYTSWPAWMGWSIGENVAVPYQWGGWSALGDLDLRLIPDDDGRYFDEQLRMGYAAGDINTAFYYPDWDGHGAAGVDCSGLVSRAWRTNTKYGSDGLRNISRPIKFEDLRAGDLLYRPGHVMLFKEFVTPERATPGTTRIRVYEASGYDWKVSEREYLLRTLGEEREEPWRGTGYRTNVVTLERDGDRTQFPGYLPRTYLNPIDIVLVIDRSGSMGYESKIESAKNAAKAFIDLMRIGDKIGVVDFDDKVTVTYPLTEIDPGGAVRTAAKNAIDTLYARDYTSIGGGLKKGQDELNTRGAGDPVRVMVLLSDGLENTPPYVANVLPGIIADKIVVYTVGLGSDADQELLQGIAEQTRGTYRFSPTGRELVEIYNSISARVYGQSVVRTVSGTVASGGTAEESVLVDSTIGEVTFSVFWTGSDLDLVLVRPDGSIVDPSVAETDPDISFTSSTTYEFYKIAGPQYGEWKMRIFGKLTPSEGEQYTISVSVIDAMILTVETDKPTYYVGAPIRITASIEDNFLDVTEPQYILGVTMEVTAEDPGRNVYSFGLYDDGLHGDGEANDGVYANIFANTSFVGSYNFNTRVSGVNNRHGQPFTREYAFSIVVSEVAPLTLALDKDWNLISFNREPADTTISTVLNPIAGQYLAILGYDGGGLAYYPDVPDQYNTLRDMDPYHGYWIKTTTTTTLPIIGNLVPVTTPLSLDEGWNLVSYLPDSSLPISIALSSIEGQYTAVLGYDQGAMSSYPELPDHMNSLQTVEPQHGYWIKMRQPGTLIYPATGVSGLGVAMAEMPANTPQAPQGVIPTNQWVDFYSLNSTVNGEPIPVGTRITAFDPDGVKVGETIVTHPGSFGVLSVYGDDPLTPEDEGARPGETITFYVNGQQATVTGPDEPIWSGFGDLRNVDLSVNLPAGQIKVRLPLIIK
jgi:uncharacterized protein YegL